MVDDFMLSVCVTRVVVDWINVTVYLSVISLFMYIVNYVKCTVELSNMTKSLLVIPLVCYTG
jgi:hypothetical protein